jgi:hypothetical protein
MRKLVAGAEHLRHLGKRRGERQRHDGCGGNQRRIGVVERWNERRRPGDLGSGGERVDDGLDRRQLRLGVAGREHRCRRGHGLDLRIVA